MRRLYLQIYLAFLAILVLIVGSAGLLGALLDKEELPRHAWVQGFAAILTEDLPPDLPADETRARLLRRSEMVPVDFALWDRQGIPVATTGAAWPSAPNTPEGKARPRRRFGSPYAEVQLQDGRWLGMRLRHKRGRPFGFFVSLLGVALVVALGAYPLARRLSNRLEALRHSVDAFGEGDLSARVPLRGRDEVALVAGSFNEAADRIQSLVQSERRLIANASHELRSPLARLRVALHLMEENPGTSRYLEEAERDIDELDSLVGDLLLGSRLEVQRERGDDPLVDLSALVAEVCEREEVPYHVADVSIRGDAKALARMLRNLIDNAVRHGGGIDEVRLSRDAARVWLRVSDRGPGVAETDRDRVFEPFFRGKPPTLGPDQGHGHPSGTGLGLALVRQIARYHGGDARVKPRTGGGCVAEVELPAGGE